MPQPLSQVARDASVHMANVGERPLAHQPKLAALAMEAIAEWSQVEAISMRIYVELAGGSSTDAASAFLAMEGAGPKSAMLANMAERKLDGDKLGLFRALQRIAKSAQKDRDKLAHWIWGSSPHLSEALLLQDPRDLAADGEGVFVYREADFHELRERCQRIAHWFLRFMFIIMGHAANRDGRLFDALLSEPEIAEKLDRQAPRD